MTRERAIQILNCHGSCWENGESIPEDAVSEAVQMAVEALEAQEPVEPVVDIDTWKCGNCGHTLEHQELLGDNVLFHEQYKYCPNCGRKVKWE